MSKAIKSRDFNTSLRSLKSLRGLVSPQFRSNTIKKIGSLRLQVVSKYLSVTTKEINLTP